MSRVQRLVAAIDLHRSDKLGSEVVSALRGVNMSVFPGQFVAVVGRSGSGKTTLLNIVGGLDRPSSGQVLFEERDMASLDEHELTQIRRHKIGFVFQSFGLLPLLSAFENVELPQRIAGVGVRDRRARAREVLEMVGLWPRARHRPYELSGGEQQRVGVARALIGEPKLILADEPTGNLNSKQGEEVMGMLKGLNEEGTTIIQVTHSEKNARYGSRIIHLLDGWLDREEAVEDS